MMRTTVYRPVALLLGVLATGLIPAPTAHAGTYQAYAGPNVFGPWTQVAAHAGATTYTINASPVGNTVIVGEVRYFASSDGDATIRPFHGSTVVTTCNCYGTVQVRFKGIPLGSAVNVNVNP